MIAATASLTRSGSREPRKLPSDAAMLGLICPYPPKHQSKYGCYNRTTCDERERITPAGTVLSSSPRPCSTWIVGVEAVASALEIRGTRRRHYGVAHMRDWSKADWVDPS